MYGNRYCSATKNIYFGKKILIILRKFAKTDNALQCESIPRNTISIIAKMIYIQNTYSSLFCCR
jgi:hypothetical protein